MKVNCKRSQSVTVEGGGDGNENKEDKLSWKKERKKERKKREESLIQKEEAATGKGKRK